MPRIVVPFTGGAYSGRSPNINAQQCINFIPYVDKQRGKSELSLVGRPGLKEWGNTGSARQIRGMLVLGTAVLDR
jgi:hypothetical protein